MNKEFAVDFELYKIFFVTAETGNITLAAKRLYLTQPNVTKHIQNLEEQLGCTLFVRTKRGVILTGDGRTLLARVAPACRMILAAEKEMRAIQSLETGSVSIVSTEMSFMSYVLPAMRTFTKKHSGIKIRFSNALNETMVNMLQTGAVDIAIMHEPFHLGEDLSSRLIEKMDEYMVCGTAFAELTARKNSPEELLRYPFVSMPEGSSTMEYLRQYFGRFSLNFDPDLVLTTVELTSKAIEDNMGIGILPKQVALPKIAAGKMLSVPVEHPLPSRNACLITNKKIPLNAAARAFVQELMNE